MTSTGTDHRIVADYLRRLETAASRLPTQRRAELLEEIRAHIDEALRDAGTADEATVRTVLKRLGEPEEIVAVAFGPGVASRPVRGFREAAALLFLSVGALLPVIGWVIGIILVLSSAVWSRRDKTIGLLISALSLAVFAVVLFTSVDSGSQPIGEGVAEESGSGLGPLEWLVVGWGFVGGLPSALYLLYQLRGERLASGGALTAAVAAGD